MPCHFLGWPELFPRNHTMVSHCTFLYRILFVSKLPSFRSHLTHEDHLESWSSEYYFLISSAQIFKIVVPSYYTFSYCILLVQWVSVSLVHLHFDASLITLRIIFIVVVQSLHCVQLFGIPWTAACQVFLSFSIFWSLLKLMSLESVMPSNHLIFCHSLLLLLPIFSNIRVFSNESALHIRWPKY